MTSTSIVEDTAAVALAWRKLREQRHTDAREAATARANPKTHDASNPRPFTGTLHEAPGVVEAVARVLPNVAQCWGAMPQEGAPLPEREVGAGNIECFNAFPALKGPGFPSSGGRRSAPTAEY
jgi:hypothetical protein